MDGYMNESCTYQEVGENIIHPKDKRIERLKRRRQLYSVSSSTYSEASGEGSAPVSETGMSRREGARGREGAGREGESRREQGGSRREHGGREGAGREGVVYRGVTCVLLARQKVPRLYR